MEADIPNDDGYKIITSYWTRLSKILLFSMAGRSIIRLRQIIDLWDIDKSRYFGITEFKNCFIIQSPSMFFLINLFGLFIFTQERRKAWLHLHMSRILFVAKHSWTTLLESRPLFVSSYLQVAWWAPGLMKSKKNLHRMIILPFIWSKVVWLCFRFKLIP